MDFFYRYIFPALILGSLLGSLLYLLCARLVYDYLDEHYHDALPEKGSPLQDNDDGLYVAVVWYVSRTGSYKRIQSNTWLQFYKLTRVLGAFAGICLLGLVLSFLFWDYLKAWLA